MELEYLMDIVDADQRIDIYHLGVLIWSNGLGDTIYSPKVVLNIKELIVKNIKTDDNALIVEMRDN